MGVTLKDIAKEAGVSTALVSYHLNGSKAGWMSEETRNRIDAAIRKLNYKPNQHARSLRTGRSRCIGMLIAQISNPYFAHLAEEALEAAREREYSLIFGITKYSSREKGKVLEFLMRNRIDALLSCSSLTGIPELRLLQENHLPVLRVGYSEPDVISLLDQVESALEEACRYLKGRGHQNIFCFFDTQFPWNQQLDTVAEKTKTEVIHHMYDSPEQLQMIFRYVAETRPKAIILNGRSLYDLLPVIQQLNNYSPDIIIGQDEFYIIRESPLIVGGILTNTTLKARRGIELLIDCLEHPKLPRQGQVMLPPAKFICY